MVKKNILFFLSCLLVFVFAVYYNYLKAQKNLENQVSTPQITQLVSYPQELRVGEPGNFVWQVSASPDQKARSTAIFYNYDSTPSALTIKDSPSAPGYKFSTPDYKEGFFFLPDNFDVNITFTTPGRVWFRSYANILGEHLWSEEKYLDIKP